MTRLLVLGGSGILWAAMMASLFRREVLPYFDYQAPPSYRDILKDLRNPEITKGEILAAGVRVGEIESVAERLFDGTSRIRTRAEMRARIFGPVDPDTKEKGTGEIPIKLKSELIVDVLYRLSRTWCEIDLGVGVATIEGQREGNFLNLKLKLGQGKSVHATTSQAVEIPKEGMVGDLFQPFPGGGGLFVGKKWKIPTMTADITGPRLGWLYATVTERETIQWKDQPVETYRVEIRTEPTEEKRPTHISWCRPDGVALKQQMTYGPLVYEIVFVSRETITRTEAIVWGRQHFARDE